MIIARTRVTFDQLINAGRLKPILWISYAGDSLCYHTLTQNKPKLLMASLF